MKRVLALQHTWDDPPGYLGQIMQEHGIACEVVDVETQLIPDPGDYDALLILGGFQHVAADDKYPYLRQEKVLICQAVEQDIPLLGVCLGGQLLANALGAKVKQHDVIELGFFEVQLTDEGKNDPLFQGLPEHQQVFQWHMDVFDIPPCAVRLATTDSTPNQAFRYGRRAYGLQYHLELTPEILHNWLRYPAYEREIIDLLGADVPDKIEHEQSICFPGYWNHGRIMFENFLKISGLY